MQIGDIYKSRYSDNLYTVTGFDDDFVEMRGKKFEITCCYNNLEKDYVLVSTTPNKD